MKKGLFFTVDAILAVSLLMGTLMVITTFYLTEQPRVSLDYVATDLLGTLSELKINETDNPLVAEMRLNGTIVHNDISVLEQIGELWAEGEENLAEQLAMNITYGLISDQYGYSMLMDGEQIFNNNGSLSTIISSSSKIVSGLAKNKTINGVVSQSYLRTKPLKRAESYAYFGGFVGQGNLTKWITDVPSDANITEIVVELDSAGDFYLFINGIQCSGLFSPGSGELEADRWNVTSCSNNIVKGGNNVFTIKFPGDISEAYLGGGYIKVKYFTQQRVNQDKTGTETYWFPGVEGIVNLYSSINIPGNMTSWRMNMTILNNYSTYVVIGNEVVANISGADTPKQIYRERNNLSFGSGTIPIRMGVVNVSQHYEGGTGNPADSILSTDVSGSMDECAEYDIPYMCNYGCFIGGSKRCEVSSPGDCSGNACGGFCWISYGHNLDCKSKMNIAKDADKIFVETVLNYTGNMVGLNSYSDEVESSLTLTDDIPTLNNRIDSYSANGGTCICCGINRAMDQLSGSPLPSLVVMSDGEENYYCGSYSDYTGSTSDSIDSIDSGQEACSRGIDVYAVGFGYDADHDTLKQVACNESMYFNASDIDELAEIYKYIAEQIGLSANFTAQVVNVTGDLKEAILYPNSTITFDYDPLIEPGKFGEININLKSPVFKNCSPQVYVYDQVTVTDARLTSYSSSHWTDYVSVNGQEVWNLSEYGDDYNKLGDPFTIQIPPTLMESGVYNNISLRTADSPDNETGCSANNSLLVFRGSVGGSTFSTSVLPKSEGCIWTIEFDDNGITETSEVKIPSDYNGTDTCSFTSSSVSFDNQDAVNVAAYSLLSSFDFDNDSMSNVNIEEMDLTISSLIIPQVPSLWGPAVFEVRVW